ncbi:hypothetical protein RHECNPAF_3500022 [Rhizobium etli CNPAF512]|nr:hypothetical protein RHECNPAF_3500022 [Rhizobium etli CNPAF512]
MRDRADHALRQEQRDGDKEAAERKQPELREEAGEDRLAAIDEDRADDRPDQRASPADRRPDDDFDRVGGREFARIDDADLRNVERAGYACHHRRDNEGEEFEMLDAVAKEARAAFGITHADQHFAEFRAHDRRGDCQRQRQEDRGRGKEAGARAVRLNVEAEDILEVGHAVIAAEPHVVTEEGQQQRIGHRLGDNREVNAVDARAEGEPAEDEGEQARYGEHHQRREPELVEAVPEPGQFLPVQEHHEVGQNRVAVNAARADLAHQIHTHRITAEREEGAVAEREDAAEPPDQIERQRQQRIGQILAEQRHDIGRNVQRMGRAGRKVQDGHQNGDRQQQRDGEGDPAIERPEKEGRYHASTALPLSAKSPRGRFWMKRMMRTSTKILPSTAPAKGSRNLLTTPSDKAPTSVPQRLPTPPKTTTMKLSMM